MTPPTKPLTKGETEELDRLCDGAIALADEIRTMLSGACPPTEMTLSDLPRVHKNFGMLGVYGTRALADLRAMRELLESYPEERCRRAGTGRPCPVDDLCDDCAWNAERKRALEGGK